MFPHKLKNFRTYVDGGNYAGIAAEIALPKLATVGESYRGAGMLSEMDTDLGLEKMEIEETYGGIIPEIMKTFGDPKLDGTMIRFVGAYQSDADRSVQAAELVVRGRITEMDPGSGKAGKDTEWKVKRQVAYLKWIVAGETIVEIDVLGMIYIVGGVDRMQEIREAIEG